MENITSIAELKNAIQLLEIEQAEKGLLLKEQFQLTFTSLRPVNLLSGTLKNFVSSPYLIENIIGSAIGLAGGYFTKKIVAGASDGIVRKLLGSVLQLVITNVVVKHPDTLKSLGQYIYKLIFHRKEPASSKAE